MQQVQQQLTGRLDEWAVRTRGGKVSIPPADKIDAQLACTLCVDSITKPTDDLLTRDLIM